MEQGWLRIKQAAEYCGVSERTVRSWLKEGLRFSRIKGIILIRIESLDSWLEKFAVNEKCGEEIDDIVNKILNDDKLL